MCRCCPEGIPDEIWPPCQNCDSPFPADFENSEFRGGVRSISYVCARCADIDPEGPEAEAVVRARMIPTTHSYRGPSYEQPRSNQ